MGRTYSAHHSYNSIQGYEPSILDIKSMEGVACILQETCLDFETSRFPDGSPYRASAKAISWATGRGFHYYTDPDFAAALQKELDDTALLIGVNFKFDIGWLRRIGCSLPEGIRIWDCQLAEFILSGQTVAFASMDKLCERYGIIGKEGGLEEYWSIGVETADIPRPIVEAYNVGDICRTKSIYEHQQSDARMSKELHRLIRLAGADLLVLQEMEWNGISYNCAASRNAGNTVLGRVEEIKNELAKFVSDCPNFNFDSGDHLSCFLYGGDVSYDRFDIVNLHYKTGPRKGQPYTANRFQETTRCSFPGLFEPLPRTALKKPGYYATGEPVLRQLPARTKLQTSVLRWLLELGDLQKQVGGFLHALPALMETKGWTDGKLHPTYNQCVARTGRLSCSSPNAQQFPEVVDEFWESEFD